MAGFNALWYRTSRRGSCSCSAYTMPVWATIAAIIGYEKINTSVSIALLCGLIGIFLSVGIGVIDNVLGLSLTLLAGLSWGIGTMIVNTVDLDLVVC